MTTMDRERLGSGYLPIWVINEHRARWRFASALVQGKVCVDCACGVGYGTELFARAGAAHVHAIDLSDDAVEAARARCKGLTNVTVLQGSATNLPLPPASVDLFISFETIEHVDADKDFLAEVARVLSPAGTFVCSTPNRAVTMPGKSIGDRPWNPFHIREYDEGEFVSLLGEYFEEIRLLGQNPQPGGRVKMLSALGKLAPGHLGGRINSVLKLPRFLYDRESHHEVCAPPAGGCCEYLVAVCSKRRS